MSVTSIETGSVLHRHEEAMSVVGRVEDADARWALLDYVLRGSERIGAALAHRPDACSVLTCEEPRHARSLCRAHYQRWIESGDVQEAVPLRRYKDKRRNLTLAA